MHASLWLEMKAFYQNTSSLLKRRSLWIGCSNSEDDDDEDDDGDDNDDEYDDRRQKEAPSANLKAKLT